MPVRPAPLPPSLPAPVFSLQEAERAGVTRGRLRREDIAQVQRGMYRRRAAPVTERDIVAALCRNVPGVFAVGLTAARLWGFPLPGVLSEDVVGPSRALRRSPAGSSSRAPRNGPETRIHMGTTGPRRRSTDLVRWSHIDLEDSAPAHNGAVPLTPRTRTFLNLGSMLTRGALVAIGDHLVRRPRPEFEGRTSQYATVPALHRAAQEHHGRGAQRVREALELVRVSSDSPPETSLRLAFVRAGLPEPLPNVPVLEGSRSLGEPDLHWPRWRVIVEYDGPTHLRPDQRRRDNFRDEKRALAGWIELSMIAEDLARGCSRAIARARNALRAHGWPG